ncbi:MAG: 1-deoxy-D-xylulose-5-phosphate reductoisomerase, partial [Lachnospiraceae bacterium]|nr:1-deoxy-D-xylulose-5-phosphate reductoisomerase [Lachnospiraceae bacterium]
LFYPDRPYLATKRVDLFELASMTFERPDPDRFEGFKHAMTAARIGGSMPTVFNAANERAVALFLKGRIGFTDIADLIKTAMDEATLVKDPTVDGILDAEKAATESVDRHAGDIS